MRSIPQAWRQEYIAGNQNYKVRLAMTLANGVHLTITNDHIWEGGFSIEEGTSIDNSFSIGSAIIGKCTVILNNISEEYSSYDFFNAEFDAYLNMVGLTTTDLRLGHYTVDETAYNGSLITLTALDNMWRFDIPFSDINYTFTNLTTARDVINAMCQYAGIGIALATQSFQGYNFRVAKPEQELNCREVLQYLAQATCNYCKMNDQGNLQLLWYDKSAINGITDWDGGTFSTHTRPYSDGDEVEGGFWDSNGVPYGDYPDADGGFFYDNTSVIGYITNNYSMEVGTDGIVVTGVKICTSNQDNDDAYDYSWHDSTLEQTHPRYTLVIQDNPFITKANASSRASTIGAILANLPLRNFMSSTASDISIEAGDPVAISDHRGNRFYSFVTNVRFQTNNPESFSCGVESVTQNKVVRYSNELKTLVEAQRNTQEQISTFDQAVTRMNNLAVNAMGAYEDYEEDGDARIYYLSNKPISKNAQGKCVFTNGSKVYKITGEGFFVSQDAGVHWTNGYDPQTGELVVNLLNAIGINAEWINAGKLSANYIRGGTLRLGGSADGDYKNGSLYIYNSSNVLVGSWTRSGITLYDGSGTASENIIGKWNTSGIDIDKGDINLGNGVFHVTNAGALTATSATITGGINATSGTIGSNSTSGNRWQIGSTSIYNGPSAVTSTSTSGTYVGTNGIMNSNGSNYTQITGGKITSTNVDLSGKISASDGDIGNIQINTSGIGASGTSSNMSAVHINKGDLGVSTDRGSSWSVLCYGTEANSRTGWSKACCVLWNGGDSGAGFHVCNGAPNSKSEFSAMKYNAFQIYRDGDFKAWFDEERFDYWNDLSDRRAKEGIANISPEDSERILKQFRPVSFKFNKNSSQHSDKTHIGFIAQEVQEIDGINDGIIGESSPISGTDEYYLTVNYNEVIPHLVNVVNKQQEEIDLLKQELAELKARIK